jgi:hypothetical protein
MIPSLVFRRTGLLLLPDFFFIRPALTEDTGEQGIARKRGAAKRTDIPQTPTEMNEIKHGLDKSILWWLETWGVGTEYSFELA